MELYLAGYEHRFARMRLYVRGSDNQHASIQGEYGTKD